MLFSPRGPAGTGLRRRASQRAVDEGVGMTTKRALDPASGEGSAGSSSAPRRGRSRDPDATRARLLKVATAEFSEHGFDGGRVERIARKAGVNINLVYHYFGSKQGIYVAALEATYVLIRSYHQDMTLRDLDPVEAMSQLVRSTFRMFIEAPEAIGLLTAENVQQARHVQQSELIGGLYNALLEFIADTLDRGERAGLFRAGVDPVELFISINAEGYFYLSNRHTLGFILHQDLTTPERLKAREEHIVAVILGYLRP